MRVKLLFFIICCSFVLSKTEAQNIDYVKKVTTKLSCNEFKGRGYVDEGEKKAADYIAAEYYKNGAKALVGDKYFQLVEFGINTLPKTLDVKVGERQLKIIDDYYVGCGSPSIEGSYEIVWLDKKILNKTKKFKKFIREDYSNKVIIINPEGVKNEELKKNFNYLKYKNPFKCSGLVLLHDTSKKIIWSIYDGLKQKDYFYIDMYNNCISKKDKNLHIKIDAEFKENYATQNIVAKIEGKTNPDSFIVFTAHYDHLGAMGENVFFPGGNDNASGTAMLLDLAKYYNENPPKYSILFISFAGEEAGLWGSKTFAENPLIDLKKIKFLINLDMIGTGSEGIMLVCGKTFTKEADLMREINEEKQLLKEVKLRKATNNSDHAPFFDKGVPCFFIYTLGKEYQKYHVPDDIGADVPFTKYEDFFKLLVEFEERI